MKRFNHKVARLAAATVAAAVCCAPLAIAQEDDEDEPKPKPKGPPPKNVAESVAGKLVRVEGDKLVAHQLDPEEAKDYFLIYFTASWNPPCRKFTPALVKFYNEHRAKLKNFEVLMVSFDDSEEEMSKYMVEEKMPWPAVGFEHKGEVEFVTDTAGRGVPCLVVIDDRGLILSHSYKNKRRDYIGVEKPLEEFATMIKEAAEKRAADGEVEVEEDAAAGKQD